MWWPQTGTDEWGPRPVHSDPSTPGARPSTLNPQPSTVRPFMKSVRASLSAGLLLAALAMAATSLATAQEYTFTTLAGPDESPGAIDGTASAARFGGGFDIGPCGPC